MITLALLMTSSYALAYPTVRCTKTDEESTVVESVVIRQNCSPGAETNFVATSVDGSYSVTYDCATNKIGVGLMKGSKYLAVITASGDAKAGVGIVSKIGGTFIGVDCKLLSEK
jgi:hypothetical protein